MPRTTRYSFHGVMAELSVTLDGREFTFEDVPYHAECEYTEGRWDMPSGEWGDPDELECDAMCEWRACEIADRMIEHAEPPADAGPVDREKLFHLLNAELARRVADRFDPCDLPSE